VGVGADGPPLPVPPVGVGADGPEGVPGGEPAGGPDEVPGGVAVGVVSVTGAEGGFELLGGLCVGGGAPTGVADVAGTAVGGMAVGGMVVGGTAVGGTAVGDAAVAGVAVGSMGVGGAAVGVSVAGPQTAWTVALAVRLTRSPMTRRWVSLPALIGEKTVPASTTYGMRAVMVEVPATGLTMLKVATPCVSAKVACCCPFGSVAVPLTVISTLWAVPGGSARTV